VKVSGTEPLSGGGGGGGYVKVSGTEPLRKSETVYGAPDP
jgi:hypothetical protein